MGLEDPVVTRPVLPLTQSVCVHLIISSPVLRHIVLMRTNVINVLNRVPEHDSLTFFVLHRTQCKAMHFDWERFSDVTLTLP